MTAFDPEKFEDKYVHYFDELQEAYRSAYQSMGRVGKSFRTVWGVAETKS